jgi:hypothetical protein
MRSLGLGLGRVCRVVWRLRDVGGVVPRWRSTVASREHGRVELHGPIPSRNSSVNRLRRCGVRCVTACRVV